MTNDPIAAPAKIRRPWLFFALITTVFWGIWGAGIEVPEKAGFPATLGYSVWALTMVPCALVALHLRRWKIEHDRRSIIVGSLIGFTGAGGFLVLCEALKESPAYIVFPIISLSPVVTIALSVYLLKERATRRQWMGIILTVPTFILFSYTPPDGSVIKGYLWLILSLVVFLAWGVQAYVMKFANERMTAESIFFYMTATGLLLIPVALWMTDFSKPINWGFKGPYLAALIHLLNSIGALTLVYALRYGKAIIVAPLANALAPVITVALSLAIYSRMPLPTQSIGIVLAIAAVYLMAE